MGFMMLLWEIVLHVIPFPYVYEQRHLFQRCLFHNIFSTSSYSEVLETILTPWSRGRQLLPRMSTKFLFCKAFYQIRRCPLNLFMLSCGNWGPKNWHKKNDVLATATTMSKEMSFVSNPRCSCLLPWNMLTC